MWGAVKPIKIIVELVLKTDLIDTIMILWYDQYYDWNSRLIWKLFALIIVRPDQLVTPPNMYIKK